MAALPSVSNEWNLCVEESVKFYGKTDEQTKRGGGLCFNSWLMIMVMIKNDTNDQRDLVSRAQTHSHRLKTRFRVVTTLSKSEMSLTEHWDKAQPAERQFFFGLGTINRLCSRLNEN